MELTFKHKGKLGDILFSLCFIKNVGGGKLYLEIGDFLDQTGYEFLRPLLISQPYITDVEIWRGEQVNYDLDIFRNIMNSSHTRTTCESFFVVFGVPTPVDFDTEPWLEVTDELFVGGVLINRVERGLHGRESKTNMYKELTKDKINMCYFVGLPHEYEEFKNSCEVDIPYQPAKDALELAQMIKGSQLCLMNHSMPLVIAEGLKKTIILETRLDVGKTDCMFNRPNLHYI